MSSFDDSYRTSLKCSHVKTLFLKWLSFKICRMLINWTLNFDATIFFLKYCSQLIWIYGIALNFKDYEKRHSSRIYFENQLECLGKYLRLICWIIFCLPGLVFESSFVTLDINHREFLGRPIGQKYSEVLWARILWNISLIHTDGKKYLIHQKPFEFTTSWAPKNSQNSYLINRADVIPSFNLKSIILPVKTINYSPANLIQNSLKLLIYQTLNH